MRAVSRGTFTSVLALILAGCGTNQAQIEENASQAIQEQLPELEAEWQAAAESEDVREGWIDSFNDPLLLKLVLEAQQNNLDLAVAAANVDRAWALAAVARSNLMPQVNAGVGGATLGNVGSSPSYTGARITGQVSWEIDVWGRLKAGQRAAVASAQAVEADLRAAQQSLAAATARAYFAAIETQVQLGIARETVDILTETTRIVNVRYENGMAQAKDLALARSDLATARENLINTEGAYRSALRALELLLGRYPAAELQLRENLPEAPDSPPAGLPSQLLERRPDLISAERRVASAFNASEQARVARLPTLSLTGLLGSASSSLEDLVKPDNAIWAGSANFLAPIYDGGRRRASFDIATAEQEQALAAYAQTALTAFGEVESNLDQGAVITQRIAELQTAVAEAESAFRKSGARYREGEEGLLDILTIQRRVTTAHSALARVDRLLLDQRVNLNLALGGGWDN